MKQLFTLLCVLLCFAGKAQNSSVIKQVVAAEYRTWYITQDGKVWAYNNNSSLPVQFPLGGLKADTGAGGFNYFRILDEQGYVWTSTSAYTTASVRTDKDTTGAAFGGNKYIDAYGHATVTIRADGSVWFFGTDIFSLFYPGGGAFTMTGASMAPTQLSPAGMQFKKVLFGGLNILGLTTSGQVYQWNSGGSRKPTLISTPGPASDIFISHLNVYGCLIPDVAGQPGGWPYIWGSASTMWGDKGNYNKPTAVKSLWKMTAPIKEISVDWNTIHYIDNLGNLYGCGYNSFGEVGNGQEFLNKYDYPSYPTYAWTFTDYENPSGIPVQIGKGIQWKHLYSNNWFGFYKYAMDVNNNLYSWGRNKSLVLGNGIWNGYDGGEFHADQLNVLTPTLVHPLTAIFTEYGFQPPVITAGANQTVAGPTATLKGSATAMLTKAVQKPSPNGIDVYGYTVVSYKWTQTSGPKGATITSPGAATTTVTGMTKGTYVFNLLATDNNTGTMSASTTVQVTDNNKGQDEVTANAGSNQTVTLPANAATLTGTGQTNGSIATFKWTQVSGPSSASIGSSANAQTIVNNLIQGVYKFQLQVTTILGTIGLATVQITVNPAPVVAGPPAASAGTDQSITLPANSVKLAGAGSETNGTITGYKWTQTSGPSTAALATGTQSQTTASGLVAGTYVFQLTVTDKAGVTASDKVSITVNPPPAGLPAANAGGDQTITLPVNSVKLAGTGSETNGTITGYKWTQTSGPSTAALATGTQSQTTASGLVAGTYVFQLTVTDKAGVTASDKVQITVNPAVVVAGPPSANAGGDQTITLPVNSVKLAGTGSETNGTITGYKWTQTSGPSNATLATGTQAQTTASGLVAGTYIFQLTVTDKAGVTASDKVQITVNPAVVVAGPPSANAGGDQTITLPVNSVKLAGAGSETNGTITGYKWTQTSGPSNATLATGTQAQTTASGLVAGTYVFQLTVTDKAGVTASDKVQITVNPAVVVAGPPSANAGGDQTITLPVNSVKLAGTGSETNGTITGYKWTQTSGPSNATLATGTQAQTTASGLVAGTYMFQLTVTDKAGVTASDKVQITVNPAVVVAGPPSANAGGDQTITLPVNSVKLAGTGSETNGTIAGYKWTQTSGPSNAAFATPTQAQTTASGLVAGTYMFQLTVTDKAGATASDKVQITVNPAVVVAGPPSANAGGDQTITLPVNSVKLAGTGSETNGTITGYKWTQTSGPSNAAFATPTQAQTTASGLVAGTYIFQLTVTDKAGVTASDKVQITVNPAVVVAGPPSANAGGDQTITLPVNSVKLAGTGSETNGTITGYKWTQTSGPSNAAFATPTQAQTTASGLVAGTYVFQLTVTDKAGATASDKVNVVVNTAVVSKPPPPTWLPIPGTIQAESYSQMKGVSSENTLDAGGGVDLGMLNQGDEVSYDVDVAESGAYSLSVRVATPFTGAQFALETSSGYVLVTANVPNTGSAQGWSTLNLRVNLPAGKQTLKIVSENKIGWNFNWMQFSFVSAATVNNIPGLIQAEDYDNTVGASLETALDTGGGYDAVMDNGDQMSYRVNVAASGVYAVQFRVASSSGSWFKLMDGTGNILATVPVPNTGNAQTWQTVTATVNLTEGDQQTLVIVSSSTSSWNINWMQFGKPNDPGIPNVGASNANHSTTDSAAHINVYPNPVIDQATLDITSGYIGRLDVQVISGSGTVVRHYVLNKGLPVMQAPISLGGLASGMYIIRVEGTGWNAVKKVLKK